VIEICLVEFLKTFLVKIFSQTNQKLKIIKSRFQLKLGTSFCVNDFYFLTGENKKSNQTWFQNSNPLKIKAVFRK